MTPRPRKPRTGKEGQPAMVKTTVHLPEELWRAAKIRAMDERSDLRSLLIRGLELVLAQKPKKGG
jgi:hypothetical protein